MYKVYKNLLYFFYLFRQMVASAKEWSSYYWNKGYEYRKENPDGKNVGELGILQVNIQNVFI